jgi:DedD protein
MGLLSFFKRRAGAASNAAGSREPAEMVQQARTRARQRLIGAAVLVVIGVVGFPLVFETQPRPIPVDIPIDIPRKDGVPSVAAPSARPVPVAPAAAPPAVAAAPRDDIITETPSEAGREVAASAAPAATVAATNAAAPAKPKPTVELPKKPAAGPSAAPSEAARAKALLDGASGPKAGAGRFVVQMGAFSEVVAARETRVKVEKLGLKTYTQVAQTAAGNRIRVRVGPFASREEADKAKAKAQAAGITAVVLTL